MNIHLKSFMNLYLGSWPIPQKFIRISSAGIWGDFVTNADRQVQKDVRQRNTYKWSHERERRLQVITWPSNFFVTASEGKESRWSAISIRLILLQNDGCRTIHICKSCICRLLVLFVVNERLIFVKIMVILHLKFIPIS